MKIAILSDTHVVKDMSTIEGLIRDTLGDVDYIIHAGDYTVKRVMDYISSIKKTIGVWGNVDEPALKEALKEKEIVTLADYRIGVFHGHGEGKTTIERAYGAFNEDSVDIIIFGHSHQPIIKTIKGILMLNPGSPTNKRKERWYSYIILELGIDGIKAQLNLSQSSLSKTHPLQGGDKSGTKGSNIVC